jgi:hypothetical protein
MNFTTRQTRLVLTLALAGPLVGCASEAIERGPRAPFEGNQGASWELVFATPSIATIARTDGAIVDHAPELSRRDAALGVGTQDPRMALESWTNAERPELGRSRTLHVPRGHDRFIYFESGPRRPAWDPRPWW